jgi:hypothetical protein
MHKVQMNSGGFNPETVKKRIACFEEFDNGHVLRSYEKMSVADSEERARKASIKDPENVYYVSYDNIMEPCSDLYWFQGKSYDNAGVHEALSQYRKSGTSGLNSGRKSLNSSDEQVRVIGTVTIYSDFVDFKKSVSEHLLQTAVGSKAKLKFKWLGDNKMEVRAICSAEDERKVKILLENSDVTKTIAWATSGNSGRRMRLGLNSAGSDLVKMSIATLKRKLKDASPEEKKAILAELKARGVYPKSSVNSSATQFVDTNGNMGIPRDTWTMKGLAEYWDSEQGSDPCLDEYASFDDWVEDAISMLTPLDSSRKLNSANDPESPFYTATDAANYFLGKDVTVEQIERYLKRKGYSDEWIRKMFDLMDEYADEQEDFDMFNSSRKNINSNRKVGNNSMRKVIFRGKLNSSRKRMNSSRRKLNSSLVDTFRQYHDAEENYKHQGKNYDKLYAMLNAYAKPGENPEDMDVDKLFVRAPETEQRAMIALIDPENWGEDIYSSRKRMNSSRRKKLNSSSDIDNPMYAEYYDKVATIEQAAKRLAADDGMTEADTVDSLTDMVAETEGNNYGKVVGFLVPKPKYYGVLDENNLSILFVLDNGDIGRQFGRRFYGVDKELTELVDMELLNSSRRKLKSSRKPAQKGIRKKLNSSAADGFEKYFDKVTDQELADYYGIDVKDITDTNADIEADGYGKVVGHYIPKDKYADVLIDGDWDTLDILEDGTVGFSLGEGGGKATRFYGVDIDSIKEAIAEAGLDSSRKKFNSAVGSHILDSVYDNLYDSCTGEEYAQKNGVPVTDIDELANAVRDNGYGDVVGYLYAKPKYYQALCDNGIEGALVLDTGEVGIMVRNRFYNITGDIKNLIKRGLLPDTLDSSRKKFNSAVGSHILDSVYDNLYDSCTGEEYAQKNGVPVTDIDELANAVRDNGYGDVVGYLYAKPKYYQALCDNGIEGALVLDTGEVGIMVRNRFYNITGDIKNLIKRGLLPDTLDSSRKRMNSSRKKLNSAVGDITADGVQDTGIDGGETAVETAELLEDAIIVQNPETKEVSLFVATEEDEALPDFVDVIADVTPVAEAEILDSSRRLKKFAAAKLNSSKGCLNSDAEDVCPGCGNPFDQCTCEPGTVAYDEIQLPDDSVVEVENILVVKGEDDNLGLFMPDGADDTVPEDYEVVAVATPVAEVEVLDSSRRLKKATAAKKLNSSKK